MAQEAKEVKVDPVEKKELPPIKYGETDLSDVILVVEEQEFHVHKMALACRSKYFKALFYGNFKEKNENRIEIKEVSRVAFRRLMDFMYRGKIKDDFSVFTNPIVVSNKDFGKLEMVHKEVTDKEKCLRDFWKKSSEMLELADRFDVKEDFKIYFQNMLDHYICTTSSCFVCVTIHIFGYANGLFYCFESHKKHDCKFVKEWLEIAKAAKIDQDNTLTKLLTFIKSLA